MHAPSTQHGTAHIAPECRPTQAYSTLHGGSTSVLLLGNPPRGVPSVSSRLRSDEPAPRWLHLAETRHVYESSAEAAASFRAYEWLRASATALELSAFH